MLSEIRANKFAHISEGKDCSVDNLLNDMPQEFIDKAILSFRELWSYVAASGGNSEHLADIRNWHVWTVDEMQCKFLLIIDEYSMHNSMFTWKSEI